MWRRRKSKKRFSGIKSKMYWVIPFIFIISFIVLFFKSGFFTIRQVEIDSSQITCATKNQIKDSVKLLGQNFFLIDSVKVEDNLKKKFYCIKSAPISKTFSNKVKIQVLNRQPVAILATLKEKEASMSSFFFNIATPSAREIQDYYIVDSEGVVFSKDKEKINVSRIYIDDLDISLGGKLESRLIGDSLKILEIAKTLGIVVSESWIFDNFFIINSDASKLKVIFRLDNRVDIQLASLQLILDKAKIDLKELEFIDLRFDKPVVRFAPKK
ncbi:MAG: FtsQ-type POTRA domain-containing protein [Candidatus Daviesbacteria bacterium]|nr:FtsQ-type POTRA domain-containing protein [Candidatus Daviesbacteria bacterium]